MAESMTFQTLKSDIETYAERHDTAFVAQIPRFIMMAENRIASEVRGLGYLQYVDFQLIALNPILIKPARWRETASFFIILNDEAVFLTQRSYTFCKSYWPNKTITDIPVHYCDYDYGHFLIVPTPVSNYVSEMAYHERPIPLDDTNQANWTTQYAPQLLLYGALLEAQPFLKNTERIAEFQTLYDRAAGAVTDEARRRLLGDQSLTRTIG
jgi:hypothetical protein